MKALASSFLAMLFVDTIGAANPFTGRVFMPAPRAYIATCLLWGVLGLAAGFGDRASRLAGRVGAVVLLTAGLATFTRAARDGGKILGFFDRTVRTVTAEEASP